jgi:hypothetical protein
VDGRTRCGGQSEELVESQQKEVEVLERKRNRAGFGEFEESERLGSKSAPSVERKCWTARPGGKKTLSNCKKLENERAKRERRSIRILKGHSNNSESL